MNPSGTPVVGNVNDTAWLSALFCTKFGTFPEVYVTLEPTVFILYMIDPLNVFDPVKLLVLIVSDVP